MVTFALNLVEKNEWLYSYLYNEIENIESIIRAVLSQHKLFHVLIIDDSPDYTADKVVLLKRIWRPFILKEGKKGQV
jgi:dolichol-phosphate mannosyltransferase